MRASWVKNNKVNPPFIVKHIKEQCHIDDRGGISFENITIDELFSVLFSAIDFDVDLPELEKNGIIHKAFLTSVVRKDFNAKRLLNEVSRCTNIFLNLPYKKFLLASSLSVKYSRDFARKQLSSAFFSFHRSTPRKFDRSLFQDHIDMFHRDSVEDQYTTVITSVKARSSMEAISKGLDALDLLRGIWNLYLNGNVGWRMSSGLKEPVNEIRLGRLHTLHNPNGELASDFFWYEPDFVTPKSVKDLSAKWRKIQKFEQWVRRRLRRTIHAPFISSGIQRYTRALDENRLDNSFLKLWSLLEYLTGTTHKDYDRMIKRVIFRYQNPDWEKQVLEHLRYHRNRAIHQMESTVQSETLVYQLKSYVEHLLIFYLKHFNLFSSLDECWQFLDMSRDKATVQSRFKLARMTLKLIESREKK